MSFFAMLRTRCRHFLRGLFRRDQVEEELREELDDYLDLLAEQKIAEGMSPHEARRAARLQFGGVDQVTEQVRDVGLSTWLESVVREFRRCFRSLVRNPLFTGLAVLTVALGISAIVTVFTIVNAVLLRPLPFPDADRLVVLKYTAPGFGGSGGANDPISGPLYFLYGDESRALDAVAAVAMGNASLTDAESPQRVEALEVTASFFDLLRTPPRIGRAFTAEEERQDAEPVILLSDGAVAHPFRSRPWRRRPRRRRRRRAGGDCRRDAPRLRVSVAEHRSLATAATRPRDGSTGGILLHGGRARR